MTFDEWMTLSQTSQEMPADANDPLWCMLVDWANDRHVLERQVRTLERALHGIHLEAGPAADALRLARIPHRCPACGRTWRCGVCPQHGPCLGPCPWCEEEGSATDNPYPEGQC